ncbi:MAG: hypothetical protein WDA35_02140 [Bacilli bacterium]|jgi:hypothetical protein
MKDNKKTKSGKSVEEVKKELVPEVKVEVEETVVDSPSVEEVKTPFYTEVENARLKLHQKYKKNKLMSSIVTIIVVALVVLAFFLMANEGEAFKYAGYAVAGVTLLGMVIYYIINKNRFPDETKKYISFIHVQFNSFVFEDKKYEKIEMEPRDKIDTGEIAVDRIYKDISQTGSRNVIRGTYDKNTFVSSDLAVYTRKDKKQDVACFVGKYLSIPNNITFSGRIIITLKGEKPMDLPTDLEDLENVIDEEKLIIHAPKDVDYKTIVGEKFLKNLKKIEIKDFLININIVIWGGHTAVYLSYTDELMTVPFENPFNELPLTQFKDNQLQLIKLVNQLGK